MTIAVNRNLSNCEKARKKGFRGFNGIRPVASALALQCSTSLSYEDPYAGGRPIYWVHQTVKGMKHRMKWCELREYKWSEYLTIAVNRNLSLNCDSLRWSHTHFICIPAVHIISFCMNKFAILNLATLWSLVELYSKPKEIEKVWNSRFLQGNV